jgi:acid phosphatase type 7
MDGASAGDASVTPASVASDTTVVVLAAGDIAACTRGSFLTARLLDSLPGQILVPGDAAYFSRQHRDPYGTCYDSTWGRHKARTRPVPGNHDADPDGMRRYFAYFGAAAGPQPGGYYSFRLGAWHVVALNSNLPMGPDSDQGRWLARTLAENPTRCALAFMHHPRFSSGPHERSPHAVAAWPLLERGGVDVLISAHDHVYERLAPMRGTGARDDARGVRQFVVGTGGNTLYGFSRVHPNSQSRQNRVHGLLKLTLAPDAYAWEFVPAAGTSFRDAGRWRCS